MTKLNFLGVTFSGHRPGDSMKSILPREKDNGAAETTPLIAQSPEVKTVKNLGLIKASWSARHQFFPTLTGGSYADAAQPLNDRVPNTELRLASKQIVLPAEITNDIVNRLTEKAIAEVENHQWSTPDNLATNKAAEDLYALGISFLPTLRATILWMAKQDRSVAMDILARNEDIRNVALNDGTIKKSFFDRSGPACYTPNQDQLTIATLALASIDLLLIRDQNIHKEQIAKHLPLAPISSTRKLASLIGNTRKEFANRAQTAFASIKNNWSSFSPANDEKNSHTLANLALGCKSLNEKDTEWALLEIEKGLEELYDQPDQQTEILECLATGFPWVASNSSDQSRAVDLLCRTLEKFSPRDQISVFEKLPTRFIRPSISGAKLTETDIYKFVTIANDFLEKTKNDPELHLRGLSSILASSTDPYFDPYFEQCNSLFSALGPESDQRILGCIEKYLDSSETSVGQKGLLLEKLHINQRQMSRKVLTPDLEDKITTCTINIFNSANRKMTVEHRGAVARLIPPMLRKLDRDNQNETLVLIRKGLKAAGTHPAMAPAMQSMINDCNLGHFTAGEIGITQALIAFMSGDQRKLLSSVLQDNIATLRPQKPYGSHRLTSNVVAQFKATQKYIADMAFAEAGRAQA